MKNNLSTNSDGKVFVSKVDAEHLDMKMQEAFSWIGSIMPRRSDRVFIKPNLTYPFYKPGVTTSPNFMESIVRLLADSTNKITFVESDGGAYAWPAQQAMTGHNIPELCKRYGARMLNLTEQPYRQVTVEVNGRETVVELSSEMLDESDLFITMPVPKMHVMTYLTLGFKNQWGCIASTKRLRNHPQFDYKILAVNKALHTRVSIYDGTYFLNRSGPMDGDAIKKDLLIVSDEVGAGDLVCAHIMGIPPSRSGHLRLAQKVGMMPSAIGQVTLNMDITPLREKFYLKRSAINWITLLAFRSSLLTRVIYDSRFAKPIHELLYLIRGRPKDMSPRW